MVTRPLSSTSIRLVALAVLAGLLLTTGLPAGAAAGSGVRPPSGRDPQPTPQPGARDVDDVAAVEALRRAAAAEESTAYSGTQFVAVWNAVVSASELVDVTNVPGRGTAIQIHGGSTKNAAAFVARDAGPADAARDGASRGLGSLADLARAYRLSLVGPGSSVGRSAVVVEADRREGTPAAKFWIDDETGLVLRRELYDTDGSLMRANAYVSLDVRTTSLSHLPPTLLDDDNAVVAPADYAHLAAQGWNCCDAWLGADPAGPVLHDVRRTDGGRTLHLSYTDGLVGTSVFEQRGRLDASALSGFTRRVMSSGEVYVRYGLSSYAVWADNGLVYTVVCDTPQGLDAAVAAFPRTVPTTTGAGLAQRLDRGMARMVSWLNPFD
ncbi:sigma-E factor regulatory protein RseB domain-containing protein [Actinopolymorpha pittospori]|uniref:Sigma-E factor negative regulatory protein RseB n=1 Tax=Actinopolymorpha pittospori TaxID=648752 RepID=A0A927N3R7_9ACTN|nr:sigma-E factor negative regulatory protein RseB [Actinopolymorpha pittospori]